MVTVYCLESARSVVRLIVTSVKEIVTWPFATSTAMLSPYLA